MPHRHGRRGHGHWERDLLSKEPCRHTATAVDTAGPLGRGRRLTLTATPPRGIAPPTDGFPAVRL